MTTGDVVYSLRFSLIKILPEPGFNLGSTAGESCVLNARLHMLYQCIRKVTSHESQSGSRKFNLREPFSATEATYKVSQNMGNFVEFTRITHKLVPV